MISRHILLFALLAVAFAGPATTVTLSQSVTGVGSPPSRSGPPPTTPITSPPLIAAEQLYRTGELEAARQAYNAILEKEPRSALAYAGLARVYLKKKDVAEAFSAASKALELAPGLDAVHAALGEVYFRQGKLAEAEHEFAPLVRAHTTEPRAYLGLSRLYRAASYYKHAKQAIDRAHDLDPADPDIGRAWIATLTFKERLKALESYLAGKTNEDPEQHRNMEEQLTVLRDQVSNGARPCRLTTKLTEAKINLQPLLINHAHLRGFGVRVNVNGASSTLMLDTGAGGILINRQDSRESWNKTSSSK